MIELRHQRAWNRRRKKLEEYAQDEILLDGVRVGIFGHQPGAKIMLIRAVSEAEQAEIEARVMAKFGSDPRTGIAPMVVPEPARMPRPEPEPDKDEEIGFDG